MIAAFVTSIIDAIEKNEFTMIRQKTQHHSNVKRVCGSLIARCKALRIFELIIALMISSVVFAEQSAKELVTAGCEKDYPPFCIVHSDGNADGF